MKTIFFAAGFLSLFGMMGCGAGGNDPGRAYMPDMYYARAYETYGYNNVEGEYDSLKRRGIRYNAMPVPGTVARGEMMSYHLTGDSAGLAAAQGLKNPLDTAALVAGAMKEAERLYLINCGICHGDKLDGNGPIYNNGNGAYPAVPANLVSPTIKAYSDGHYFHVITYGIRSMGSYGSQLTPQERWWVIKYIRSKQGGAAAKTTSDSTAAGMTTAGSTTAGAGATGSISDTTRK